MRIFENNNSKLTDDTRRIMEEKIKLEETVIISTFKSFATNSLSRRQLIKLRMPVKWAKNRVGICMPN